MSDDWEEASASRQEEIEAQAEPAGNDLEAKLNLLKRMADARRKDPVMERRYERLRNSMAKYLDENGPRYFLDGDGTKQYAYAVVPEPLVVDVDELIALYNEGEITLETLDEAAPRKASAEGFKRVAHHKDKLSDAQLLRVSHVQRGTPHVRYMDPEE